MLSMRYAFMAHERVLILYTSISASPLKTSMQQQKNSLGMENKLDLVEWFLFLLEEITDLKEHILSISYTRVFEWSSVPFDHRDPTRKGACCNILQTPQWRPRADCWMYNVLLCN